MNQHASLIARLCEASEGSAELSAEVHTALTGSLHSVYELGDGTRLVVTGTNGYTRPCLTTDLSAAWEEAKREGLMPCLDMLDNGNGFEVHIWDAYGVRAQMIGKHEACTLCAAILAAEGER